MARHIYECPLRWSDMDAFGHVNNAVFLRYLEEARIDFMFRLSAEDDGPSFSGGSVVARHEIDYLRPLVHRHKPVTIESWVTKIGAASLTISYEIKEPESGGQVYVRASTIVVPFDLRAQRPRRITAEERAVLEEYRDGDAAGAAGVRGAGGAGALVA
ncbi:MULTISPECIES: acyl-CoA thioesterase [Streptomyces]|uniref:Thioesterase n=1 Tax=Streptomyces lasiicapitis TaxID=1923961 RepID=A0ABQ2MN78_9ACTN|nr:MULTISPECIES: thioesterase family protein [Streptomyces]QIB45764.1 acyl-CoA thioesterase [Streptomyces aureoverticillatus]GGO55428.1 thioesterase [Streptomyces lasiicapitis]